MAAAYVSASFFDTLCARPLEGRTFLPHEDDPGAERVIVLSYGVWQRRFGGDPTVVGRKVNSFDQPFTIVGVMPREFDFPQGGAELWTPVGPALNADRRRNNWNAAAFRSLGVLYVIGRLKEAVSLEGAQADLAGISRRLSVADNILCRSPAPCANRCAPSTRRRAWVS